MKKLLHERLRDMREGSTVNAWSTADEIERYYIPRPRFENGEVVDWDSEDIEWDDDTVQGWAFNAITQSGVPLAYGLGASAKMKDGFVVRKQPKVLDADGVEIKEGENRYSIKTGEYLAVNQVGAECCLCTVLGDGCTLGTCGYKPSELSSKEPDSLERIKADRSLSEGAYMVNYGMDKSRDKDLLDRAIAFIERGA